MSDAFARFESQMRELKDLTGAIGILSWDQETFMPAKAGESRARQLATLQGLYHERLTAPQLGDALAEVEAESALSAERKAMARNVRWERDRALKVPPRLVRELAERQSLSVEAWRAARQKRDFALFQPHLEPLIRLKREQADALGHAGERYDALLEAYEPGMRVARLVPLFASLRQALVPLVKALVESGRRPANPMVGRSFSVDRQWEFTLRLLRDLGFDLEAGRQDRSTHPFTGGASHPGDVRLTTRLVPDNPLSGFMSTIHECGHGLYEQGFAAAHAGTYLAQAPSFGLHESQSRFWENMVGRSLPFWEHYLPVLREFFPTELKETSAAQLHAYLNRVEPSPVRVEADEVTYNLHVLLRFELELGILRGDLQVDDLPEAWNERMKQYLGITPRDDVEGLMQDIHWAWGEFGYFPTYTIGNLYSAMLLEAMQRSLPDLWGGIGRGEFKPLLDWLRRHIHQPGYLMPAEQLVESVTGSGLSERPFVAYLNSKYRPLYGLS